MSNIILTMMYHRVSNANFLSEPDIFYQHLTGLTSSYPAVTPGDRLPDKVSVCLTFDDAYFDFYYYVYPLLKELNIKAVLAVSPKFILEDTAVQDKKRLAVPYNAAMKGKSFQTEVPFCTWKELNEMQKSGHVVIASHSYSHANMSDPNINFKKEVLYSKTLIEEKLNISVDTFVYPYGKMNKPVHSHIKKIYKYIMRIGSALNKSWENHNNCIYRIDAEKYWPENKAFKITDFINFYYKYLCNTIRNK